MNIITEDSFVVEWSPHQKEINMVRVKDMLEANLLQYKMNTGVAFIPLAFFQTREEAHEFCDRLENGG